MNCTAQEFEREAMPRHEFLDEVISMVKLTVSCVMKGERRAVERVCEILTSLSYHRVLEAGKHQSSIAISKAASATRYKLCVQFCPKTLRDISIEVNILGCSRTKHILALEASLVVTDIELGPADFRCSSMGQSECSLDLREMNDVTEKI